jgi:hypothetical protein
MSAETPRSQWQPLAGTHQTSSVTTSLTERAVQILLMNGRKLVDGATRKKIPWPYPFDPDAPIARLAAFAPRFA